MLPALLAVSLLLAACASTPPPARVAARRPAAARVAMPAVPAAPAPAAVNAPGGLDGRWTGTASPMQSQAADGVSCGPSRGPAAMSVNGGRAALVMGQNTRLEGSINDQGGISLRGDTASARGDFHGQSFTGDAARGACSYRLNLRRIGR